VTEIRTDATFDVSSTPAEAWKALEQLRVRAAGSDEWWLPGFECRAAEVDVEHERRLTVRKLEQPCADTLISVTFEHAGTGTRVRVVQSGFDEAFVNHAGPAFWIHSEHLAADLHLFLETGVVAHRAWRPWVPLGVAVHAEPFGLRVATVQPDTWADRIGVHADDILLTIAGAPLYDARELGVVERIVRPGDDVVATWARGDQRCEASALV
jgi:hypothetical protein